MYIDDVINIFDEKCDPVIFQEKALSHFMYADDLVLLSSSETGLQICLDRLQNCSGNKHLTVSISKSKTMIFSKTGKLIRRVFKIGVKTWNQCKHFVGVCNKCKWNEQNGNRLFI